MRQQVPEGYSFEKMIANDVQFFGGIEYNIDEVSVIKDRNGFYYVRNYRNSCGTGGNGRPQTVVNDYCVKIPDPSAVNESYYFHLLWNSPHITFRFESGTRIDYEALQWVKEYCAAKEPLRL